MCVFLKKLFLPSYHLIGACNNTGSSTQNLSKVDCVLVLTIPLFWIVPNVIFIVEQQQNVK